MSRQLSRQKMLEIQRSGMPNNGADFSTQASQQSKRSRQLAQPLREIARMNGPQSEGLSPSPSARKHYVSRPHSIQRSQQDELRSLQPPSYINGGGGTRADQSALDHIRRIRRNIPSQ